MQPSQFDVTFFDGPLGVRLDYGNDDRGQSYDDDGRGEPYEDEGRYHERRRGYDDERRDDNEESERGDDDVFRSADHVTMQGVTDT